MNRTLLISLCFCIYSLCVFGQTTLSVRDNPYQNLGKQAVFREDKLHNTPFEVIEALPDSAFKPSRHAVFNGGTTGKVWWMKLRYTEEEQAKAFLVLSYSNIDYIDIYYRDSLNRIGHIKSGTFNSSESRAFMATEYIFELPADLRGQVKEIYVRAQAMNTLLLPVKLVNGKVLSSTLHYKYFWQVVFIGFALSIFLFNLFMLILTRDKLYALYMVRILALFYLYVLAYLNGYAHFFGDQASRFTVIHAHVFAAIGFIATIYFNSRFLNLRENLP